MVDEGSAEGARRAAYEVELPVVVDGTEAVEGAGDPSERGAGEVEVGGGIGVDLPGGSYVDVSGAVGGVVA
jgi:hypothetical protein